MHVLAILTGLMATATFVAAAPVEGVAKRDLGGVLICQGVNATGLCHYEKYSLQDCHDVPAELYQNAATFAPDGENFFCYPRTGKCSDICKSPTGCTFGAVNFNDPRKYDLTSINWQNYLGSFHCYENTTATAA